jgi:hypothetical protein
VMLTTAKLVAIIAGIAFLLSVAVISYLSSPPSTYPTEQQAAAQTKNKQKTEEQHSFWGFISFLFPDAISIFTFWLVLATALLGIVAVAQIGFLRRGESIATNTAEAAKQSADVANATLKLSQRAWIGIDNIRPVPLIPVVGSPFTVIVTLKNTGNTPARKVYGHAVVDPVSKGGQPNFSYESDRRFEAGIVTPGAEYRLTLTATTNGGPLPQAGFDAMQSEAMKLYTHGRIDYEDIFGEPHWFTFCLFLLVPFDEHFGFCPDHNDTDDYRPKQ